MWDTAPPLISAQRTMADNQQRTLSNRNSLLSLGPPAATAVDAGPSPQPPRRIPIESGSQSAQANRRRAKPRQYHQVEAISRKLIVVSAGERLLESYDKRRAANQVVRYLNDNTLNLTLPGDIASGHYDIEEL